MLKNQYPDLEPLIQEVEELIEEYRAAVKAGQLPVLKIEDIINKGVDNGYRKKNSSNLSMLW